MMHRRLWVVIVILLFSAGCQALTGSEPMSESQLDTALADSAVPKSPPATEPGEPQKEFEQEVTVDSVNL